MICRFAFQFGYGLDCRFGMDCHGLLEFERKQSELSIKEIEQYNSECDKIVNENVENWKQELSKMGRWLDFENVSSTSQAKYMENVWKIFKQFWDNKLIYKDVKIVLFSVGRACPISYSESMCYRDADSIELTISIPLISNEEKFKGVYLMTYCVDWKLIADVALCVNPEQDYVKISLNENYFILSKSFYEKQFKEENLIDVFKGSELIGMSYVPAFDYYSGNTELFRIIASSDVITERGSGIIHLAPGISLEDYNICKDILNVTNYSELPYPIDETGKCIFKGSDFEGMDMEKLTNLLIENLRLRKILLKKQSRLCIQSYCRLSGRNIIYKFVEGMFLDMKSINEKLLENRSNVNWFPESVSKRILNIPSQYHLLSNMKCWGTPIPIWMSEDGEEIVIVESIEELKKWTGISNIENIRRESIDHLTFPSPTRENIVLKRVPYVFDASFESGCFSFADIHPKKSMNGIATEGINQVNDWIFFLQVIGTVLDLKPVNTILATGFVTDNQHFRGNKWFSSPETIQSIYGADALRLYLLSSASVCGESLTLNESGVQSIFNDNILPLYKMAQKPCDNVEINLIDMEEVLIEQSTEIFERWITSRANSTLKFIHENFSQLKLTEIVKRIIELEQEFITCYWTRPLSKTLVKNLHILTQLMAPLTPFLSEHVYKLLGQFMEEGVMKSIHLQKKLEYDESLIDLELEELLSLFNHISNNSLTVRQKFNIPKRSTIPKCVIILVDDKLVEKLLSIDTILKDNINCTELEITNKHKDVKLTAIPNMAALGKRFKQKTKSILSELNTLTEGDMISFLESGSISVNGEVITEKELQVCLRLLTYKPFVGIEFDNGVIIFEFAH